jgi:hypothetical protein
MGEVDCIYPRDPYISVTGRTINTARQLCVAPSSKALYHVGFQDIVAITVARYRPLAGHDRTVSGWT